MCLIYNHLHLELHADQAYRYINVSSINRLMPMNGLSVASGEDLLYTEPDTTWRIQGETGWRDNLYGKGVTTTTK
ncbi:MAG: hypothetical protein WCP20_02280 [Desulfuromonadales bacterium]